MSDSIDLTLEHYQHRDGSGKDPRYTWVMPDVFISHQEVDRGFWRALRHAGLTDFPSLKLVDVGCGSGSGLLRFLRWGFRPGNLMGIELMSARADEARSRMPPGVRIETGNALTVELPTVDIVTQSMAFTSILDADLRRDLAAHLWRAIRPGGGFLWYDFVYDNPNNRSVIGLGLNAVGKLFPEGQIKSWRVTLAPPVARRLNGLPTTAIRTANAVPWLRTHRVCWIQKR